MNYLYAFFVCAEHLNFSKAATILGITQPSLSQQIKNFEEQLGTPLFLRNGKSVSLTSKGHELQKSSSLFFDLKDEVSKCVEEKTIKTSSPVARILVTDEVERPFVAEVLAKVARRMKGKLEIFSSTTEEALSRTVNNQTDILLSHEKVATSWKYIKIDFPVFFVTSSTIPKIPTFDNPGNVLKVMDYFGQDLIIPAGTTKLGKELSTFMKKENIKRTVLLESNIVSCLARFVSSGTGCTFLPLPYIKSSLYQNRLFMVGPRDGYWKHSIYIYANKSTEELDNHPLVKIIRGFGAL